MRRQRGRVGLMAAALVSLAVGGAQAQVTTERSASILVFPRVISDGTRDTIIQITNTSNSMVHAHCFYVNGAVTRPEDPPDPILNPPRWNELDYDIWLTKQQPTHWVVSEGRLVDPSDRECGEEAIAVYQKGLIDGVGGIFLDCNGAGLDPGFIPPVEEFFTGELKCIEVDMSGHPVSGNHLKGEATTVIRNVCDLDEEDTDGECTVTGEDCTSNDDCDEDDFDVAKYNAIGIPGNENNNGDGILCLGGEPSEQCPNGAEYDACPEVWIANHFADDAPYPIGPDEDAAEVDTTWTIVPCTQNFESQDPETIQINVLVWNEFESVFSTGFPVTCWEEFELSDRDNVFDFDVLGSAFAQSRLRSANQSGSGFLMVGTEEHEVTTDPEWSSFADVNYFVEGFGTRQDIITIPPEQLSEGAGPTP